MKFDGKIDIAKGMSAGSKVWKNTKMLWSDFLKKLSDPVVTNETFKEFIAASKQEQHRIKDVGGYVGGYLRGGKRTITSVGHRQLLTLDIDFAHLNLWSDFTLLFDNAAILHATHKHSEASPRYRLIMPLSREVAPDEYVAIARKVAEIVGIELFDNTTFDTNRLMFWASIPKDVDYYFEYQDGEWLDADKVLDMYIDWTDSSLWATSDLKLAEIYDATKKQEDPELKKGIIGAFCRTYGIEEAIEKFLSDVYTPTFDGRYTYTKGSTASGLIVYDDKFAYSHHGTDPCSGKLCNVWDLVRIHLYGHLDFDLKEGSRLKSYTAMEDLVREDKETKKTIASEKISEAKYDFDDDDLIDNSPEDSDNDTDWLTDMEIDGKTGYRNSAHNISLILKCDPRLKDAFKHNSFDAKRYVYKNMPWRKLDNFPDEMVDVDYSGIRNYIERIYGIEGKMKIEDSLAIELHNQAFHPVREYLGGLTWDGVSRIDTLLIRFFEADDNIYTREATRKALVGAVNRVFVPGCKLDYTPVLVGKTQGTGKSSFIRRLGKSWFSDSFNTVSGKESYEQIQGKWIIEIAELSAFKKAEAEAVKHYLAKQDDYFRPAYGRVTLTLLRQCSFWGTSNTFDFLRDPTGNRRYWPIDINTESKVIDNIELREFLENDSVLDQVWAEAVHLFKQGERPVLSREAEKIAEVEQRLHSESDERTGIVDEYLNTLLPEKWDSMDLFQRRNFILGDEINMEGVDERGYVCIPEIWCECLGKAKEDMSRYNTRELNDIMKSHPDWIASKSTRSFKIYGTQRYYVKKLI